MVTKILTDATLQNVPKIKYSYDFEWVCESDSQVNCEDMTHPWSNFFHADNSSFQWNKYATENLRIIATIPERVRREMKNRSKSGQQ